MNSTSFYQLPEKKQQEFFSWLAAEKNNDPAYENMWHDDWSNKSNTLPYILTKTEKYKNPQGDFYIIYDNDAIVACGGVYISPFNNRIAIAGTRTWTSHDYRNKALLKDYLLPLHKEWAVKNKCCQVALTFNEYNKNIIAIFKRTRLGENKARTQRQPHHLFYTGLNEVGFPVCIQKTKQWVIYESIEPNWQFDWKIIAVD